VVIGRRSLLLAGAAFPTAAYGQCVTDVLTVDACRGGVRPTGPPGRTLDLNFMFPGSTPPGVTFTRASTATYTDASGVIQTAAVNQPRWDYAGGSLRGLLIEEARTNLLLNSATLGTQSVAVTAQAYTLSFYGTGTVTKSGVATGALVGTGAGQRVSQTFTPTAGTLTLTVTGSVINAQIEPGAWASSYIPTTGATATRAQDRCNIPPANLAWFSPTGGSWFIEFVYFDPAPANARVLTSNNTAGSWAPIFITPPTVVGAQYDGISALQSVTALTANTVAKVVSTWIAGQAKVCTGGGPVATSATLTQGYGAAITAAGVFFMQPVPTPNSDNVSGCLRRVQYWPRVLSDVEMQQVTT
jgi:hypothetical protein